MKKIKTGVIGYGFSGRIFQCPFVEAHESFELTGVVERNSDNSIKDYPNIILYRSLDDMLKNDEIELIIVATPNHLHFEQAKKSLEHGKHVLIEKPYAGTYEEALTLNKIAKDKNLVVTVYQNRRYDGDFLTIKKLLDDGVKIYEYEATWDRYVPKIEDTWHERHFENSLLYDLGPHYLDQALTLFGVPEKFTKITHKLRENSQVIDYFSLNLEYKDKVVRLKSSLVALKEDVRYKLHTDNGSYYFYVMGEQEHQLLAGMKPDDPDYGDNALYDHFTKDGDKVSQPVIKGNYLALFTDLANAIRNGGKPTVTPEEAARVIQYLSE